MWFQNLPRRLRGRGRGNRRGNERQEEEEIAAQIHEDEQVVENQSEETDESQDFDDEEAVAQEDQESIQTEESFVRPVDHRDEASHPSSSTTSRQVRQPQPRRLSAQARFWRDMRSSPMGRLRSVSAAFRDQNERNRNLARQRSRSQSSSQ